MQCGWLLPQVVNQKQTTNTLGVSAMKFYERPQFPSGFFSNSRFGNAASVSSVSNPPRVTLVSPNVTILASTCQSHDFSETAELTRWTNTASQDREV